jgi:hypothetical protein
MTGKRKRARPKHPPNGGPWKKAKTDHSSGYHPVGGEGKATVSHPLLSLYYPRVVTLRDYFLSKLPSSSRARQRRVASLGIAASDDLVEKESGSGMLALGRLLDSTLVGVPIGVRGDSTGHLEELEAFSQSQYHSPSANSVGSGTYSQSEVGEPYFPFSPTPVRPPSHETAAPQQPEQGGLRGRRLSTS